MNRSPTALEHVLLVSDMDDTLLNHDKKISAQDLDAIEQFRAAGGTFAIATGRSIYAYAEYADALNLSVPVILNNGGMLYDLQKKQVLWESLLPADTLHLAQKVIHTFPQTGLWILTETNYYSLKEPSPDPTALQVTAPDGTKRALSQLREPLAKVSFSVVPADLVAVRSYLEENVVEGAVLSVSGPSFCDLMPSDSSKEVGVRKLVAHLGFEEKKIYTIGDYFNDLPLLAVGDVSASMIHAPKEVQEKADFIFHTDHALQQFIAHIMQQET